ncbi:MAG: hypothetical protein IH991_25705 [Planctomycetes bacterium]|nr:hypothetical protein [Planctomycetota bacterium]
MQDHGGTVYYDFEWELDKGVIDDAEPPGPEWLRELIGIDYFADVVVVDFDGTEVKDLDPLRGLTQLLWLDLNGIQVSDLSPLGELTQLRHLDLTGIQFSDLGPLRELTQLLWLDRGRSVSSRASSLSSPCRSSLCERNWTVT